MSIMTGPPGRRPEEEMKTVTGPLLVLWGSKDPCTPVDGPIGKWFTQLPQSRPDTEFVLLPGAALLQLCKMPEVHVCESTQLPQSPAQQRGCPVA